MESTVGFRMTGDDADLLERIRNGAPDDFAQIVRRHQRLVFSILHRYERDPHRLEDLAQDTFIKVWRSLDQFDERRSLEHWIARIAVNAALDHLRKEKRRRQEVAWDDLGEGALDWLRAETDEAPLEPRHARELLEAAMRELSPAERCIITLQEIEGRSIKEICALTGSSGVAVRVRALRARRKLRKALERLGNDARD